jgi:hypothetical protein
MLYSWIGRLYIAMTPILSKLMFTEYNLNQNLSTLLYKQTNSEIHGGNAKNWKLPKQIWKYEI